MLVNLKWGVVMEAFGSLSMDEKKMIIKNYASLIFAMPYHQYIIRLYSWDRFFIEEYYDTEDKKFTRISIAGDPELRKYLDKISFDSSLQNLLSGSPETF